MGTSGHMSAGLYMSENLGRRRLRRYNDRIFIERLRRVLNWISGEENHRWLGVDPRKPASMIGSGWRQIGRRMGRTDHPQLLDTTAIAPVAASIIGIFSQHAAFIYPCHIFSFACKF